ncbi:unnamed protein product, partial [Sphacelaria rigidula]
MQDHEYTPPPPSLVVRVLLAIPIAASVYHTHFFVLVYCFSVCSFHHVTTAESLGGQLKGDGQTNRSSCSTLPSPSPPLLFFFSRRFRFVYLGCMYLVTADGSLGGSVTVR